MTKKRLRVKHITVQAVLVWDDGKEFTDAQACDAQFLAPSEVKQFLKILPSEVKRLQEAAEAKEAE